jgi:deoxyribodipyrimidine photo-lyase
LGDNRALSAAIEASEQVIPAFIIDPYLVNSKQTGPKRLAFLWGGLQTLDKVLRDRGSYLVTRSGRPEAALKSLQKETGAEKIYAQADFSPYARKRDQKVSEILPLALVGSSGFLHPDWILKKDGSPYVVFTPYKKRWRAEMPAHLEKLAPVPENIHTPERIESETLPGRDLSQYNLPFYPGEKEAIKRLEMFFESEGISDYEQHRNRMDLSGTSQLSPYLRFGMISPQQAVQRALEEKSSLSGKDTKGGAESWMNELTWRDFYISILYHFPEVMKRSFRANLRKIAWVNNRWEFDRWREGKTGFPVVDAGMRQLAQTGWMHNRARMITASFLVKDLLIDWRWGESWFMQQLIDGDPAANNGGWQWTAGTGTDAAPYFRIFNPTTQGLKFDPNGDFIRKWVTELNNVPTRYIHTPWEMSVEIQKQIGCRIGVDYPERIIDHKFARQRTLDVYNKAKADRS